MKIIYFKKHERIYGERKTTVIAMCDVGLIGKKYSGKNGVLDLATYAGFYKGEEITLDKAKHLFDQYLLIPGVSFNLVGVKTIEAAGKFLNVSKAKKIATIPHLQVYRV